MVLVDQYEENYYGLNQYSDDESFSLPQVEKYKKLSNKINLHSYVSSIEIDKSFKTKVLNALFESGKKIDNQRLKIKDKRDRATIEQVLDPRTRIILFKLLNSHFIDTIDGCISTGKEANVYHATAGNQHIAIKIYKTSILTFKDRDRYVTGEFRFRQGYCRHNPRKMVKTWAEKEMRNLIRIYKAGIKCPQPLLLKSHVLAMQFLGHKGWPYPLLKDVNITDMDECLVLYEQAIFILWDMYRKCKLIHADLSEYNIIYAPPLPILESNDDSEQSLIDSNPRNETKIENDPSTQYGQLYVIDVSQSVEWDHPRAFDFLRKDITNILDYFGRQGVMVAGLRQTFDFITDPTINEHNKDQYFQKMSQASKLAYEDPQVAVNDTLSSENSYVENKAFEQVYIPQNLSQVIDYERDIDHLAAGLTKELYYCRLTGLSQNASLNKDSSFAKESFDDKASMNTVKDVSVKDIEHGIQNRISKSSKSSLNCETNEINEDKTFSGSSDSSNSDTDASSVSDLHSENTSEDFNDDLNKNKYVRPIDESPNSKKERKLAIKEEKREKRQSKIPKYEKKKQNAKKYCRQGWKRK